MMVCPEGIEPPTHSLEGCCSIQLSYGQVHEDYTRRTQPAYIFSTTSRWRSSTALRLIFMVAIHAPVQCCTQSTRRKPSKPEAWLEVAFISAPVQAGVALLPDWPQS